MVPLSPDDPFRRVVPSANCIFCRYDSCSIITSFVRCSGSGLEMSTAAGGMHPGAVVVDSSTSYDCRPRPGVGRVGCDRGTSHCLCDWDRSRDQTAIRRRITRAHQGSWAMTASSAAAWSLASPATLAHIDRHRLISTRTGDHRRDVNTRRPPTKRVPEDRRCQWLQRFPSPRRRRRSARSEPPGWLARLWHWIRCAGENTTTGTEV